MPLSPSEEQLKELYELSIKQSPDAILVTDQNGKTILTNAHFDHMLAHVKGPEDLLRSGDDESTLELDGRVFDRYSTTLFNTSQQTIGRLWHFHETTASKQLEIQLRMEKETLEKYFEVIGIIVLVIDPQGKILYLNDRGCALLEYRLDELIGKNWVTDVISKNINYTVEIFLDSVKNPKSESAYFEFPVISKNGKEKYITWGSTPIENETGTVTEYLCTGEDISDLRKTELDLFHLKELDKLKDEFLNIVAHELKTPLTSIIGLSELLKLQQSQLPQQLAAYPNIIFEEGMRLKNVVNRILTVTRFESGKEIIHLTQVHMKTLFTSLQPVLDVLAQKKKCTLVMDCTDDTLQINTDKDQISEVIINLVDNAIKYGPEGQVITVSVGLENSEAHPGKIAIVVKDQGPGIPEKSKRKLFNKFSQLEPSLSRSQEGTGLGLYICKLIVERLGGSIEVQSEVGKGSSFIFYLSHSV
jgi:PAS domain S-box-containing protein